MTNDNAAQVAVRIERTFDAPIGLVWQMWTRAEHFRAWYGPAAATIVVAEMDLRVGGKRLVCMQVETPNGTQRMCFAGAYVEINENKRLVYTESIADEHGNALAPAALGMPHDHPTTTTVTVELEDIGERTKMVMIHAGIPADSPGAIGWAMAFDKLAAYLASPRAE